MQKKKILFLGAGYASLSTIKALDEDFFAKTQVSLINNNSYHYHTILLHKVASNEDVESPKFDLLPLLNSNIELIQDEVVKIKKDKVITKNGEYGFDILVCGLGFTKETFGIKGMQEYALSIDNYENALKINEEIYKKIKNYRYTQNKDDLKIAVCGGGLSGVEFIASLALQLQETCEKENIAYENLELSIIEAMDHILPMFDAVLASKAKLRLENLGIKVYEKSKIIECERNGIRLNSQDFIKANTIIWTAGVRGNSVIENSDDFLSVRSRIEIDEFMHPINIENANRYFFIGDNSILKDPKTNIPYPPTAQLALRQGAYVAKSLINMIANKENNQKFKFISGNTLCSIGKDYAVGTVLHKPLSGKIAIKLKIFIEKLWQYQLQGIKGFFR
ncbi:FAD-dependent oxidoreductase [Campylobacter insulaenigrae]|uniref:NAD(P)/FAD-dependent oxidoreductase n=1 Tax=Campylobacter insulaenigrae TaxID=260714 RepID=A0ABY3G2Z9_9BACT|nr:FAD-dependent oxidoreductase [Campylobacter insulaenigrae]MCR6571782.1 FAD-dependent oxidoreductase [Campylobacter insulaenigrae]MCR6573419.1 FAD-dependent oxidoreductase [Campylobacter insulaenigrae]MCR6574884.1 FAD-dependent oxidoreductase [Campylobacter insulaenigrae]MCR6576424.1 FAD-dependent oxidoreductase [Campylobacter insulaenigrae]MCR6577890.1 FAD-dependent oxidoreductase [Campylobacter insulaenigrae]